MNNSLVIIFVWILSIVSIFGVAPLIASLLLHLFSRFFKFPKKDFKIALYCNLIILGIFTVVSSSFSILFLDKLQELINFFIFVSWGISFISGIYVVHRFYGASILKSFISLFLTGLILFITFTILIILIGVSIYLLKF